MCIAYFNSLGIFWDITRFCPLKVNGRLGEIYLLHLQNSLLATCFHASSLLAKFNSADGGDMFVRNVG
jgi:hypothetical protein